MKRDAMKYQMVLKKLALGEWWFAEIKNGLITFGKKIISLIIYCGQYSDGLGRERKKSRIREAEKGRATKWKDTEEQKME